MSSSTIITETVTIKEIPAKKKAPAKKRKQPGAPKDSEFIVKVWKLVQRGSELKAEPCTLAEYEASKKRKRVTKKKK